MANEQPVSEIVSEMKQQVSSLMQGEPAQESAPKKETKSNGADSGNGKDAEPTQEPDSHQDEPEFTEFELSEMDRATKSGWKSREKYPGSDKDFVDFREWNRTVKLLKRIDAEREENSRLRGKIGTFSERVSNVMQVAKQNALAEIEAKKKIAVEEANYSEVNELDKQKEEINRTYEVEAPDVNDQPQQIRPEVEDWMADNPWFDKDSEMTEFALDFQLTQLNKLKDPRNPTNDELSRALKKTTRAVKAAFPDQFQEEKQEPRHRSPTLERSNSRPKSKKLAFKDLSPQEQIVCKQMVRTKAMTEEQYIQAIADMRNAQ